MMTGIMAIFEMGLSLTGQSLLPTPIDVYFETPEGGEAKLSDKGLLKILANSGDLERGLSGQDLCNAINDAGSGKYSFEAIVDNSNFDCQQITVYPAKNISHRMLVKPPSSGSVLLPYELFSCTSDRSEYQCFFERIPKDS